MKPSKKKIVALIPLRGGSKSIRYKNIKPFLDRPLAYWVCKAATDSKYIDEVWVSTEDAKIKGVVEGFNLGVKIIDRPQELASDSASTESVMLHFAEHVPFDIVVTVQATAPLTKSNHLDEAIEKFNQGEYDSLVTGVPLKRFFWTHDGKPLNYDPGKRPLRQEWQGTIMENGAFYITHRETLNQHKSRLGGKIAVHIMGEEHAIELDEPSDWEMLEEVLRRQK